MFYSFPATTLRVPWELCCLEPRLYTDRGSLLDVAIVEDDLPPFRDTPPLDPGQPGAVGGSQPDHTLVPGSVAPFRSCVCVGKTT
jgi:hypothetical protein